MPRRQIAAATISLCLVFAGCCSTPTIDTRAEADHIRRLDSLWQEAMNAKDTEATAAFFAEDGAIMPANSPSIVGRDAIKEWFDLWMTNTDVVSTFSPDTIEVAASGDLAYDRGTYQFSLQTPDGLIEDDGKYVIVWKKIDGEWLALLDMSSSNRAGR